jgi:hypothetical protein
MVAQGLYKKRGGCIPVLAFYLLQKFNRLGPIFLFGKAEHRFVDVANYNGKSDFLSRVCP